jgi:hemolysin D
MQQRRWFRRPAPHRPRRRGRACSSSARSLNNKPSSPGSIASDNNMTPTGLPWWRPSTSSPRYLTAPVDRSAIPIENELVDLRPGMAVAVEINAGTRRVIDYLLSPLRRYTQESLRER